MARSRRLPRWSVKWNDILRRDWNLFRGEVLWEHSLRMGSVKDETVPDLTRNRKFWGGENAQRRYAKRFSRSQSQWWRSSPWNPRILCCESRVGLEHRMRQVQWKWWNSDWEKYFKSKEDDAGQVLLNVPDEIWNIESREEAQRSIFISSLEGNAKEILKLLRNCTHLTLIVMLKILQTRASAVREQSVKFRMFEHILERNRENQSIMYP